MKRQRGNVVKEKKRNDLKKNKMKKKGRKRKKEIEDNEKLKRK